MVARIRDRSWTEFVAWCQARRLRPLPAHPWTLAAYARWCETRHRYPVIVRRVKDIARAHLLNAVPSPHRHPTVTRTLRAIERRDRTRDRRAALFVADDLVAAEEPLPKGKKSGQERSAARRGLRTTPPLVSRR